MILLGDPARSSTLSGFSVLLTASRRTTEWSAAFTRLGAQVTISPTLSIEPLADVDAMIRATRRVIANPPEDLLVTTAIGWRGWIEAADAHGLEPELMETLTGVRIWARGAKVRGAVQGAGLQESLVPDVAETSEELAGLLLAQGVAGRRMAIQLHGSADLDVMQALDDAGAEVEAVPVYRWGPAPDPLGVERAVSQVCARGFDAVVFASAPGARAFLQAARDTGCFEELLVAMTQDVVPAAVGPVTAEPLREAGLDPLIPDRYRLGALVRVLTKHLTEGVLRLPLQDGGLLELRGRVAMVDGEPMSLSPTQLAVLRRLSEQAGEVVDREQLLAVLPGTARDLHAVEVNVSRLRVALGRPGLIQTVVKRGYRLAVPLH